MAKVLIAGCGDIGCRLGKVLVKQGHSVTALRRNAEAIPSEFTALAHDLTQPLTLSEPYDYVFYTASAGKYQDANYYQAYVLGLKNLLKALSNQPPKHLFFTSSTSVFGQSDGEWVTEDSPTSDSNFSARRLLQGEALLNEVALPTTIVRFGGLYGPGRTHLIDLVKSGKAHCMEGIYSNRIHTEDAINALAHLMQLAEQGYPLDSLYIAVDDQPSPTCEIIDWLAERLNVDELEHQEPTENSRQLRSNKRLSNQKLKSTGFTFKYPNYQSGYKAILQTFSLSRTDKKT